MKNVSWIVALLVGLVAGVTLDRVAGGAGAGRPPPRPAQRPGPQAAPPLPAAGANPVAVRPDDPARGPEQAKLHIALFSDFQCPFCARVEPILSQIELAYRGQVRVSWKHLPLGMHPEARPAAEASEAAREQGKFWPMHDKLFAAQRTLGAATYEAAARELGLDVAKFKERLAAHAGADRIAEDEKLASSIGVQATPTWFVNCRRIEGAYPFDSVKPLLDEEIKHADALIAQGKTGAALAQALCEENVRKYPRTVAAAPTPPPALPGGKDAVPVRADDPAQGKAGAPVTLVVFSDFQCPWCARAEPTLQEIAKAHPDDVRIVWKHFPLTQIHPNALPAAVAAEAARSQGGAAKFWAMHAKLFANQASLTEPTFVQYAKELGLDVARFKRDLADAALRQRVNDDMQLAQKLGVNGTPTFIVNGERAGTNTLRPTVERLLAQAKK